MNIRNFCHISIIATLKKLDRKKSTYLYIFYVWNRANLVGESVASYSNVLLMFGFAIVAIAPALLISRMISPENKKRPNPVKGLPMECGQVPSGAGRTHFMMQYYAYVLMFVIFDVMAIFLYAWGSTILNMPRTATLPIIAFLGIMFAAMAFALYQSKRKNIW